MMLVTFVRTADELLLDCCKSWENWHANGLPGARRDCWSATLRAFGGNILFPVIAHGERRYWAGGIEEDVILPIRARGTEAGRQVVLRVDGEIQFEEAGVTQQLGRKLAAQRGKAVGGSEDE